MLYVAWKTTTMTTTSAEYYYYYTTMTTTTTAIRVTDLVQCSVSSELLALNNLAWHEDTKDIFICVYNW